MNKSVAAIIVTYNRKQLLKETIIALKNQTYKVTEIIVVNNASTDGTKELLCEIDDITVINLEKNVGGAGGFNIGIRHAFEKGHDKFWIMDDDTIADTKCLEYLIDNLNKLSCKETVGYLASNVLWIDGKPCLMNIPTPEKVYNEHIHEGIIKIKKATFVSLLVTREAVRECGLPISEFFIWADDSEFTQRLNKKFNNYFISNSIVIHKMKVNLGAEINKDSDRLERYYYAYRNRLYIAKKSGVKDISKYIAHVLVTIYRILFKSGKYKAKKIFIMFKGILSGIFFNPKIEYVE